ncbi:hypothetical protein KI688_006314 [Linnemannia hyalina]|uniref:RING-type domain-containing protein n=1 Tax=Linnemannia hyalina TaxID=64524 RepID=A0A9P7Y349_9FUNG|nr:hypothetical protein KI688_006314 [Linnemannia hyalina]
MTVARSRTEDSVFSGRSAGVPTEASLGSRSEASHASNSSRPDPSSHIRFGGLFVGLSNSRGGTSISSSLMPLQPNSEDEDDYGHTAEDDRSQRRASSLYHHLDLGSTATDTEQQHQGAGPRASAGESRRPRPPRASRYPPPDLVAELIQGQFEQALTESGATASSTPTIPSGVPLAISATTPSIPTEASPSWTESIQQQQQQQQQQHQHQHQQQQQHQRAAPSDHLTTLPRPNSSSTSLETVNNSTAAGESHRDGSTSAGSSTSETPSDSALGEDLFGRRSTRIHRRRLRSSSLRGLLGFQPMSSVVTEERLAGTSTVEGESLPEQRNRGTQGPNGNLDRPRLVETRFFARLIAELGRGLRGHSAQTLESSGDRVSSGSTAVATAPTEFATEPSLSSNSATNEIADSTGTESGTTPAMPLSTAMETTPATDATSSSMDGLTTEPSPPVRPRRHTTIRFIQIGESGRFDLGGGRRSRNRSTGTGLGSLRSDSPEGTTGLAREDLADAIIMLLSNASTTTGLEGESSDNAPDGPEGSRPGRSRRSPWLVLTLSGAFLGSLLAGSGGEEEEGGMSYDDLWALSNLIGPARPTTTTQEAIDNAGFHVGQFDDASKGMRGFHTLGDGSKCLVCMSDYEEGEDMRALSCKHGFHQECIDKVYFLILDAKM